MPVDSGSMIVRRHVDFAPSRGGEEAMAVHLSTHLAMPVASLHTPRRGRVQLQLQLQVSVVSVEGCEGLRFSMVPLHFPRAV